MDIRRAPLVCELPDRVLTHIAALLDVTALHNWRSLVALLPDYTQREVMALTIEEQNGRSASMEVLHDLHSRGWTVVDLALLAHRAQLAIVADTIREFYQDQGTPLSLPASDAPLPLSQIPQPARTCYDCPSAPSPPTPPSRTPSRTPTPPPPKANGVTGDPTSRLEIPYHMLADATGDFCRRPYKEGGYKLGQGGFGEVFYGRLYVPPAGTMEVAVKVLNQKETGSKLEDDGNFDAELRALCQLSHPNLLPVLGFSSDGPRPCIIYQFMPHGSLETHLTDPLALPPARRVGVACDVAAALEYLHCGSGECVVHRDIKSANILLTSDWQARLGDFGVLRFLPSADTMVTTRVVGTLVYMAPEYTEGLITPAADVYAFGVVLYELLTGLSAQEEVKEAETDLVSGAGQSHGQTPPTVCISGRSLLSYVLDFDGEVTDILIGQWPEGAGQKVWSLAEQCVKQNRKKRPTAIELLTRLEAVLATCL